MLFIFKKKKIVVDCFTSNPGIHMYYPVTKYINHIPEWWKNLPSTYKVSEQSTAGFTDLTPERPTLKKCPGIIDLFKAGITITLGSDLKIQTKRDGSWAYLYAENSGIEPNFMIDSHSRQNYGSTFDNFIHMKIISSWLLYEKSGVNFYSTPAFWNQIEYMNKFHITPGIVNYKYQHTTNVNLFANRTNSLIELSAGMPLINLIPLSEHDVEIKNHVVSDDEYHQLVKKSTFRSKFVNSYGKQKKILTTEKKCPFNFGKKIT